MRAVLCALVGAAAVAAALGGPAAAGTTLTCPEATVGDRLAAADVSFVGSIVDVRPAGDERLYTFEVDQLVAGELAADEVTVLAEPLVDANGEEVGGDIDVGVFAELDGGRYTTDSCGLVDPSLLLAAADEPRGGGIKLAIGVVILAAVLALALVRLRRRGAGRSTSLPR